LSFAHTLRDVFKLYCQALQQIGFAVSTQQFVLAAHFAKARLGLCVTNTTSNLRYETIY